MPTQAPAAEARRAPLCCPPVDALAPHRRGQLYVALGAIAWSTAGVLQRELAVNTPTQLGGRAAFAFMALLTYVWLTSRAAVRLVPCGGRPGLAVAVCMAVASGASSSRSTTPPSPTCCSPRRSHRCWPRCWAGWCCAKSVPAAGRDGDRDGRGRHDVRDARRRRCARRRRLTGDGARVRDRDRDHPPPSRRLDGPRHLPRPADAVAGVRAVVRLRHR